MAKTDKEITVETLYFDEALESIKLHRRYWSSGIPRVLTSTLARMLKEAGYPVTVREEPPQWEHVFFITADASPANTREIEEIAKARCDLSDSDAVLPI